MKFSTIFDNEETTATQKVHALADLVSDIRKKYGNTDLEISVPETTTTEGVMSMLYLTPEDKVVMAKNEIRQIVAQAITAVDMYEGVVLDREIEGEIATNPVLCNLRAQVVSNYL